MFRMPSLNGMRWYCNDAIFERVTSYNHCKFIPRARHHKHMENMDWIEFLGGKTIHMAFFNVAQ